jgi:hypothetical protein
MVTGSYPHPVLECRLIPDAAERTEPDGRVDCISARRRQGDTNPVGEDRQMERVTRRLSALVLGAIMLCLLLAAPLMANPAPVAPGGAGAASFPPASNCGCHGTLVDQWSQSMHSRALEDPIFKIKVAEADAATAGKIGPFCQKCHGPAAVMTGESGKNVAEMSPAAAQAVGCMFCHQVVGNSEPLGNVSQLLEPDLTRRAQLEKPEAPHPAVFSALHVTSAICGGCHNVNHPINGMHLESTYREWAESPQGKAGTQCQDCHMSEKPGKIGPSAGQAAPGAPQRPNIYQMTFAGAQVALGNPERATQLLQSAAKVEMDAPRVVKSGEDASVTVKITNSGAGHYLPTGLTEVREMWLDVSIVDSAGKSTNLGEHRFGTVLKDAAGKFPAELWDAVAVQSDDRIPPMQSVTHAYKIALPSGTEAGTLKAQLLYRSVPEELAAKAGVKNPTTVMASAEQPVFGSSEAEQKAAETTSGTSSPPSVWLFAGVGIVALIAIGAGLFWWGRRSAPGSK